MPYWINGDVVTESKINEFLLLEEYLNHLGHTDNFTESGAGGLGIASADATNHEFDLSEPGNSDDFAYFRTKTARALIARPVVINFIVANMVSSSGGGVMYFGMSDQLGAADFTNRTTLANQHFAGIWQDTDALLKAATNNASGSPTQADITISNGDLVTIFATTSQVVFYVNGVLSATLKTTIPAAAMKIGACVSRKSGVYVRGVSVDMMNIAYYG